MAAPPTPAGGLLVVLTGAGISKESGLDTFRDPDGIWARYDLEEVATPEGFARNPAFVHEFYNARRRALLDPRVRPNAAHLALADLERRWPGELLLVTQNIDDLHERAGSRRLLHMHGELLKARCAAGGEVLEWRRDLTAAERCPGCGSAGSLRPPVGWFGEVPFHLDRIFAALEACDLFLAVGTSGQVYPAASFAQHAVCAGGARAVELNLEPSALSEVFHERIHGPAGQTVPAFVRRLLG